MGHACRPRPQGMPFLRLTGRLNCFFEGLSNTTLEISAIKSQAKYKIGWKNFGRNHNTKI